MRTIKQRLFGLAIMIVVVCGGALGVSYHESQFMLRMDKTQDNEFKQLNAVSKAQVSLRNLLLAAMDAIVDKESGAIDPELKKEMADSDAVIDEQIKILEELAEGPEEKAPLEVIKTEYEKIAPMLVDLEKAITFRAGDDTFAHLDDIIDGKGGEVGEQFDKLRDLIEEDYFGAAKMMTATLKESLELNMAILGASAVVFCLLIIMFGRSLLRGLNGLGAAMAELARGNLSTEVPGLELKNELGAMAQHVQFFKRSLLDQERMREEQEQSKRLAEVEKKKAMQKMASDFEAAVSGIVSTVAESSVQMKSFAQSLTSTAEAANHRASSVAAASEEAAANVSTVAAATEELSASISEISRQVSDSSTTAGNAVTEARNTNKTVTSMADAANKIGEVVQLISEIANQTNLLALNATIEAARAGEAGKGFAVVASEVKNLAAQTAKATEDITLQISGMQSVASEAVKAIQGIGSTIEKINNISTAIAAAVEEQGSATAEISRNVQEAAAGTKDVSENIGGVTQAASETGQVAEQVLHAASALETESTRLKSEVAKFIATVRAA